MSIGSWIRDLFDPWAVRQRRLMREREGYELANFLRTFGRDADIAEDVWNSLRAVAGVDGFKPAPEDELLKVFGLAEEELEDLVLGILTRCGCRIPPPEETRQMEPMKTVAGLVAFIAAMRESPS